MINLTKKSFAEFSRISAGNLSPKMAANHLRSGCLCLRSFQEVLGKLSPEPELEARLSAALCADDPAASLAAIRRTVHNWFSGRSRPQSREEVFHIAFALGLSEPQLNVLLGQCFEYGVHYREGRELVYSWFLRMGKSYREARQFYESLPAAPNYATAPSRDRTSLTHRLKADFLAPQNEEELRLCYLESLEDFGRLHARAYQYFEQYLSRLVSPAPEERDFSIEEVMRAYLNLHMPIGRSRAGYTVVQRMVKHSWPSATMLKNIRLRKADVPRKLLLLLYVVTENSFNEDYCELDEEYITLEEKLEDHWVTLNVILADCGMPPIDMRDPTDWLVMYALTAGDEPMSQRLEQVIDELYKD